MTLDVPNILGIIGVSGILGAYFLSLFRNLPTDGYPYLVMNFVGASLACISSVLIEYLPFVILEGTWAAVSLVALVRKIRRH
ncbi:MAG: CBU_0592 family membrane protein [Chitinophagales bacterium]